jgi:cell pole-organizing protein PopZ
MSPSESSNGRAADSLPEGGVLAALPRARPQRASARRAAARPDAPTRTDAATKTKGGRATTTKKVATVRKIAASKSAVSSKKAAAPKRSAAQKSTVPPEPPAPKQGYEAEEELELGKTVNPPSGVELVESVTDIVGELANSGLTAGGRLLKDAFSLLRRP